MQAINVCPNLQAGAHHIAFGDLLGAEGLGRAEVHAVVVAQVVVGHNGGGLNARAYQEVHQHTLHLGLAALEVVAAWRYTGRGVMEGQGKGKQGCDDVLTSGREGDWSSG